MTEPQLYDTEEAARLLGVDSSLIRKWKHRGQVTPRNSIAGRGRGGVVPLYALEDLRPLVTSYRTRQKADTP